MPERLDRSGIVAELSLLYELSLSIGTSLDLQENCDVFLTTLMARKNLSYAGVWIDSRWLDKKPEPVYRLVLGMPTFRSTAATMHHDHPVAVRLRNEGSFQVTAGDPGFGEAAFEPGLAKGACLVLRLGDVGFLKLHRLQAPDGPATREINQLNNVLHLLTVSLQGCLAHRNIRQEIDERVRSEQALRASEGRYRWVTDHVVDVIWTMGLDQRMTYVSPSVQRFRGVGPEEALGQKLSDILTPGSMQVVSETFARLNTAAGTEHDQPTLEVEFLTRDGGTVWGEISAQVLRDENGRPIEIMGVTRDITHRKRAQEALVLARDEALEASRAKSAFLANMSHEIRTPLSGIIGMADLLARGDLDDRHQYMVGVIQKSSRSLRALLNNILDFSKIEAGRLELDPREYNLRNLVEETAAVASPAAMVKGLDLHVEVGPEVPARVVCDADRLRQVLTNLVTNAVKFTDEGHVKISVGAAAVADGELAVTFAVADTGIGIAARDQQVVFESFRQADGTTSRRYDGTGLGLAISSRLVELMGGAIDLESSPGVGSTFRFTVNLPVPTSAADVRPHAGSLGGRQVAVIGGGALHRVALDALFRYWDGRLLALDEPDAAALGEAAALVVVPDCDVGHRACTGLVRRTVEAAAGRPCIAFVRDPSCPVGAADGVVSLPWPFPRRDLLTAILEGRTTGARPSAPRETGSDMLAGKRILVAEDNEYNRIVLKMMLSDWGCTVVTAANGSQAVEAVGRGGIDAVLMDVQMPGTDGLEATRRIRRLEGPVATTPIIAATAHAFPADRDRCIEAGMNDYVAKPVEAETLLAALTGLLGGRRNAPRLLQDHAPSAARADGGDVYLTEESSFGLVIARKLAPRFGEDTTQRIASLRRLQEAADAGAIRIEAHTIAGAAATIGALRVEAIARDIMARSDEAGEAVIAHLVDDLEAALAVTMDLLQADGGGD